MPQLAVGLAGAAIGSWAGSTAIGWTVGLMIGNYLFAPDGPDFESSGPRLTDLSVGSAADGSDMPVLWGTGRMGGQIIWSEGINERIHTTTTTTGGGKGGGGESTSVHTSYSYSCSFACSFGLFKSSAIRRIWANKRLIYDARAEIAATSRMAGLSFTFYGGSESQEPNAAIEAHVGTGNVSAYRGQTYIVFNNLPLADFGGSIPSIEAEFTAAGATSVAVQRIATPDGTTVVADSYGSIHVDPERALVYFFAGTAEPIEENFYGDDRDARPLIISLEAKKQLPITFEPLELGEPTPPAYDIGDPIQMHSQEFRESISILSDFLLPKDKIFSMAMGNYNEVWVAQWDIAKRVKDWQLNVGNAGKDWVFTYPVGDRAMLWNGASVIFSAFITNKVTTSVVKPANGNVAYFDMATPTLGVKLMTPLHTGNYYLVGRQNPKLHVDIDPNSEWFYSGYGANPTKVVFLVGNDNGAIGLMRTPVVENATSDVIDVEYMTHHLSGDADDAHWPYMFRYNHLDNSYWLCWQETARESGSPSSRLKCYWTVFDANTLLEKETFLNPWHGGTYTTDDDAKWDPPVQAWTFDEASGAFFYVSTNSSLADGKAFIKFDTQSREYTFYNIYDEWGGPNEDDICLGNNTQFGSGFKYNPQRDSLVMLCGGGTGGITEVRLSSVTGSTVGVAEVIRDLCAMAGVESGDVNTSDVTGEVTGFRHSRRTEVRGDLQALMTYGNIDALQSDWQLKFVPRGGSSVATIDQDDMGAYGDGETPEYFVERTKVQGVDKPTSLDVMYLSADNDFQPANALTTWYTGGGQRKATINLPIFLPDADAAFASERLLLQQVDGDSFSFNLTRKYSWIEPTDPLVIPAHGEQQRVRMLEVTHGANDLMECKAVLDDVDHLTSYAAPSGSGLPGTTIVNVTYAEPIIIDTALLRDADLDQPGPYMAAVTWADGYAPVSIYTSADGQTYSEIAGIGVEPTFGVAETVPNDLVNWENWDTTNTIQVQMLNGSLSSITAAEAIAGGNAVAYGREGNWEIMNFTTATLVDTDTYEISGLLRGRRGTQWARNNHAFNDWVILLDTNGSIIRVQQAAADIASTVYYKSVIAGQFIADAIGYSYVTGTEPYMPYSPIQFACDSAGGDYALTWTRRTRRGGSLGGDYSLTDGVGGTISEDSEEYELDIFEAADLTTPVRTVTAISSASYTYTGATATSDGFVSGDSIVFRVYQISAVVDRGHPSDDLVIPVGNNTITMPEGQLSFIRRGWFEVIHS